MTKEEETNEKKESESREKSIPKNIKKKKEDEEIDAEKKEEENLLEPNKHIESRFSYLREPGPGAGTSIPGCPEQATKMIGDGCQSSTSSSSSGTMENFAGNHGTSRSENYCIRKSGVICSGICSCSTAAVPLHSAVLAGTIFLNNTQGGKTTGGRNEFLSLQRSKTKGNSTLPGPDNHPRGLDQNNIQQIKSQLARLEDR